MSDYKTPEQKLAEAENKLEYISFGSPGAAINKEKAEALLAIANGSWEDKDYAAALETCDEAEKCFPAMNVDKQRKEAEFFLKNG